MEIDYEKAFKIASGQRDALAVQNARALADIAYLKQMLDEQLGEVKSLQEKLAAAVPEGAPPTPKTL